MAATHLLSSRQQIALDKFIHHTQAKPSGDGYIGHCPMRENHKNGDANPSFSIYINDKIKICFKCHSQNCHDYYFNDILKRVGIEAVDLYPEGSGNAKNNLKNYTPNYTPRADITNNGNVNNDVSNNIGNNNSGLTLQQYADYTKLPIEFLRDTCKLKTATSKNYPAPKVHLPYFNADGTQSDFWRVRVKLHKDKNGDRFIGKGEPLLYGLQYLKRIQEHGWFILVEGESDWQTLIYHGVPALACPGTGNVNSIREDHIKNIKKIFIFNERDGAGEKFVQRVANRLAGLGYMGEIRQIDLRSKDIKDLSDLHKRLSRDNNISDFKNILQDCLDDSSAVEPRSSIFSDADESSNNISTIPIEYVHSLHDFLVKEYPPIEWIVDGVLSFPSFNLLVGKTGLGKSNLLIELCYCIANNENFLAWPTSKKWKSLYIDGEMHPRKMQERFTMMQRDRSTENIFYFNLPDYYLDGKKILKINHVEAQSRINGLLKALEEAGNRPDLIIMDNLSCLSDADENDNTAQSTMIDWFSKLRREGYAVILVHHTNKEGGQRGANRKEDIVDTYIKLEPPTNPKYQGAEFKITFSKTRDKPPKPHGIQVEMVENAERELEWLMDEVDDSKKDSSGWIRTLATINEIEPQTQKELIDYMKISKITAIRHIKILRKKGLVEPKNIRVTWEGIRFLNGENYEDSINENL